MVIAVGGLLGDAVGTTWTHEYEGPWDEPEPSAIYAKISLLLIRTDRGVSVSGQAKFVSDAKCSRCLQPVTSETHLDMDEEYLSPMDLTGKFRAPFNEEEDDRFRISENHEIELSEALRQHGIAAMPIAPICKKLCRGLCPHCGTNFNEGNCDCAENLKGPLAALEGLFAEANESR